MAISVLVNGAAGRMGQVTVAAIEASEHCQLVGTCDRDDDLAKAIQDSNADVVIDFTPADVAFVNAKKIIESGAHPVIGSSGLLPEQVETLRALCAEKKLGGIIAPNFCIGAVLMMQFSAQAAKYFPHAEVIEYHHEKKQDAPSGTAIKTADTIANMRDNVSDKGEEVLKGARGAMLNNVPIHSVRLPGMLAHQEVIFGNPGELLTIRHDSFTREAYMPGVLLACEAVVSLDSLVYGLEHVL